MEMKFILFFILILSFTIIDIQAKPSGVSKQRLAETELENANVQYMAAAAAAADDDYDYVVPTRRHTRQATTKKPTVPTTTKKPTTKPPIVTTKKAVVTTHKQNSGETMALNTCIIIASLLIKLTFLHL